MDVRSALIRQKKAMELLLSLLKEEYEALKENQPQNASSLEFSVQELLRQMFQEKEEMVSFVQRTGFNRLSEYLSCMEESEAERCSDLIQEIQKEEDKVSAQAVKNVGIARALAEQSSNLARYFFEQTVPRQEETYSAQGTWYENANRSSRFLRGRL